MKKKLIIAGVILFIIYFGVKGIFFLLGVVAITAIALIAFSIYEKLGPDSKCPICHKPRAMKQFLRDEDWQLENPSAFLYPLHFKWIETYPFEIFGIVLFDDREEKVITINVPIELEVKKENGIITNHYQCKYCGATTSQSNEMKRVTERFILFSEREMRRITEKNLGYKESVMKLSDASAILNEVERKCTEEAPQYTEWVHEIIAQQIREKRLQDIEVSLVFYLRD